MNKTILNGKSLLIDPKIQAYTVHQKPSSNIDYFGFDLAGRKMFIQFKNGGSYIYNDVDDNTMEHSLKAESIGKYLSANVIGKFISTKLEGRLITVEETEDQEILLDQLAEGRLQRDSQETPVKTFLIDDLDSEPEF